MKHMIDYGDGLFRIVNTDRYADDPAREVTGVACRGCGLQGPGRQSYGVIAEHSIATHGEVLIATYSRPIAQRGLLDWFIELFTGPQLELVTIQCDRCYQILPHPLHRCETPTPVQ